MKLERKNTASAVDGSKYLNRERIFFFFASFAVVSDGHYSNRNQRDEELENMHFTMTSSIYSQLSNVTNLCHP